MEYINIQTDYIYIYMIYNEDKIIEKLKKELLIKRKFVTCYDCFLTILSERYAIYSYKDSYSNLPYIIENLDINNKLKNIKIKLSSDFKNIYIVYNGYKYYLKNNLLNREKIEKK